MGKIEVRLRRTMEGWKDRWTDSISRSYPNFVWGGQLKEDSYRLWPLTREFQALVPRGSIWMPVPERAEPITNHLHVQG